MNRRFIFHLSIPVASLQDAERFYTGVLGATIGRRGPDWIDALLWGHQITQQLRPDEVLPRDRQGKRHFGVVLPWTEWHEFADRLREEGTGFLSQPEVHFIGTPSEEAKLYLEDPAHNIIEIKAYRDPQRTRGAGSSSYAYTDA